jgi:hypothetical protein
MPILVGVAARKEIGDMAASEIAKEYFLSRDGRTERQ